ncbi:MAG TPA: hypothetical protein VJ777_17880 [Mycobacterium sp.]|nr:hypothetical protein [Mycobacterium sp.]
MSTDELVGAPSVVKWRWEGYDRHGKAQVCGDIVRATDTNPDAVAAEHFALMLYKVEPEYEVLRGWKVLAWPVDDPTVVGASYADEWLALPQ